MLPDIPRYITGLAEWLACLIYILLLPKRFNLAATVTLTSLGLVTVAGWQLIAGTLPLSLWVLGMIIAFSCMAGLIGLVTKLAIHDVFYIAARAFVLAELVASLEWQIHCFYLNPVSEPSIRGTIFLTVIYAVAFTLSFFLEKRHFDHSAPGVGWRIVAIAMAFAIITFALSNLTFITPNTPFSGEVSLQGFYIRTLVDAIGFVALYAQHEQLVSDRADQDLARMNAILQTQHDQYLAAKRDVETAARTAHDLKHQLEVIRAETDKTKRDNYFDKLAESLQLFGEVFDTGNQVLDIMLTAKARFARSHDIHFSCVADGSKLTHIAVMDLASIIGNALDNATEAVLRLKDKDKRLIRVAIINQGKFVIMRFENIFDGTLRFSGGQIATRKIGGRHGLGLRSIREVAAKYAGQVKAEKQGEWFVLSILLPAASRQGGRRLAAEISRNGFN